MDYYHLRTAKTFDEFVKLIEQSNLPFDVRQHICSLLDSGLAHASDGVVDDIFDDMTIHSIIRWFEIAKPKPSECDVMTQIGCHFEEVAEMLTATNDNIVHDQVHNLAEAYKQQSERTYKVPNFDRLALLDALCDQIVTAIGVGYMMGFDMEKALAEVNRSNYTKFAKDEQGNPVPYITPNGKIGKNPDTYQEPKLGQYAEKRRVV